MGKHQTIHLATSNHEWESDCYGTLGKPLIGEIKVDNLTPATNKVMGKYCTGKT